MKDKKPATYGVYRLGAFLDDNYPGGSLQWVHDSSPRHGKLFSRLHDQAEFVTPVAADRTARRADIPYASCTTYRY